ncbi:MAG: trigger factor [Eggerthia catenaformis]|uniref:trigger factor n=1 Tax=Eggerthia catenaformis TaxID=31973 RepID=UPI00047C3FDD|nr:trigger factor [Eggerthia catenaformis]
MKTVVNKLENSMVEVKVTFEEKEWKEAQDKALNKLAATANLDGFRKGHAPKALIKARVGSKNIQNEAVDVILQESYSKIFLDNKVEPVGQPTAAVDKMTADVLEMTFKAPVAPEITLGEYKGLNVKKKQVRVSSKEVDERVENYRNEFAELVIKGEKDAIAENGDTVTIDFEGFKDGAPFEGGKSENYPLELGSGSFIPGFEEQVVGMKADEEKEINVTFPENYQAKDLAGAAVVFKVKVHEIKSKVLPEADDELAKDVNIEGVETLEDLKKHIKEEIKGQKEREAEDKFSEDIVDALIEKNPFEVPEAMIENEVQNIVSEINSNLKRQGLTLEMYQQMMGQTMDDLKESVKDQAEKRVKYQMIISEIVKAEDIQVSDEEVEKEIGDIAAYYGNSVEEVKKTLAGQEYRIKGDIAARKASTLVKENVSK